MERIEPGKYVELGYDLYQVDANGEEEKVHQTDAQDPEKIIFGVTQGVVPELEKALAGLAEGDKYDVVAHNAYGSYDPEQVVELDHDVFVVDGEFDKDVIKKGAIVPMMTADGYRINGVVLDVTPEKVKMDFNHPLAGKTVRFEGKVLKIRDATPEEIAPAHSCGCGCGHHHEEEGDACGCSDCHCH